MGRRWRITIPVCKPALSVCGYDLANKINHQMVMGTQAATLPSQISSLSK